MAKSHIVITHAEQREWIEKNIPHRVRVFLANSGTLKQRLVTLRGWRDETSNDVQRRCETDCIWEGRKAAMRWLIELVGIKMNGAGQTARWVKRYPLVDVRIDDFLQEGAGLMNDKSAEADKLARVWQGCSQSSGHATHNSGHHPVNDSEMDDAREIIIRHLDQTLYANEPHTVLDYALRTKEEEDSGYFSAVKKR